MKARPPHSRGWWVILDGATPTAFRARIRDTLLPTLHQLHRTQPNVTLRWVERGRVWESPDQARDAALAARRKPKAPGRPREWRPGGQHRDPRQRYELTRDQKRARFRARQQRPARPGRPGRPPQRKPGGHKGPK